MDESIFDIIPVAPQPEKEPVREKCIFVAAYVIFILIFVQSTQDLCVDTVNPLEDVATETKKTADVSRLKAPVKIEGMDKAEHGSITFLP